MLPRDQRGGAGAGMKERASACLRTGLGSLAPLHQRCGFGRLFSLSSPSVSSEVMCGTWRQSTGKSRLTLRNDRLSSEWVQLEAGSVLLIHF